MDRILRALVRIALAPVLITACRAAPNLYVVTHVDIVAPGGNLEEPLNLLREFVAETRKDPGAVRAELLQQDNRHNHFTIVEVWQTRRDFDAHLGAAHTKRFREKIQPMLGSPFDERLNTALP